MSDLKPIVEALLFVSESPLTIDKLCDILNEYNRDEIRSVVIELQSEYNSTGRGIFLDEIAGGFQFRSRKEYAEIIRRLEKNSASRFSKPALETLAIVAYRQPITRSEIEYLRGVESGGVLRTLLEKNLLKILGKKNIPGKPLIYGTSRKFLEIFNLKDLKSLPTLKEIQELEETTVFEKQDELPLQQAPDEN
ncbi:MAG TPA: SMC-Scp complex subunit ScpB [Geobacteraceae bacterium]|nr:SMC-Scp complex subunit ScpB [Geobacteraceae bacterium]